MDHAPPWRRRLWQEHATPRDAPANKTNSLADMEVRCALASRGIDPEAYWWPIRAGCDPPPRIAELVEGAKGAWRLLLQIDSDEESGMEWGDIGMLYFWVTERGLRAGDFDDTWVVLQTT